MNESTLPMNHTTLRLSAYYFAVFLVIGVYVPFLPTWLQGRGLSAEQVGMIFALALWARIPAGLALATVAERSGRRRLILILCSFAVLLGFAAFTRLDGYTALLAGWLVVGTLLTGLIPMTDALTMTAIGDRREAYGKIRLWGSLSFIAASVLGGIYLQGRETDVILTLLIATAGATALASLFLPVPVTPARSARRLVLVDLFRDRPFMVFIFIAALLQASHAALYGFATLSWKAAGLGEGVIGFLWAEGVVAEILLFIFGQRLMARFRVWQVLALAAAAGLLRWSVLGLTADLPWLIAVQGLHALTFAGTHLAAVLYIARRVPQDRSVTAQTLYDGMAMGLIFGIAMMAAGWVYETWTSDAFFVMALLSALGGLGALVLAKMQH